MNENKNEFLLEEGITYLNHGSFGACSKVVFEDYQNWQVKLEKQPVQFFTEELYSVLKKSRESLSLLLGCDQDEVLFFQNPTTAISNIIYNLDLNPDDEVLMTDHEYGALVRAWNAWGKKAKVHIKYANVTLPLKSKDKFFEDISSKISSKTKVLFLSHITSPTGLVFPIKDIIDFAKERKIITIVDGAHVPGHIDLHIHNLGCDFYTGALHKWMCGLKGVSFLFVKKEHQKWIKPVIYSWGKDGDDPTPSEFLQDFQWQGTRDMSSFLTIPTSIEFYKNNLKGLHSQCRDLNKMAFNTFQSILETDPISVGGRWIGQMVSHPLPKNIDSNIKSILWDKYKIEIPIFTWNKQNYIRLSIQVYNDEKDVNILMRALKALV